MELNTTCSWDSTPPDLKGVDAEEITDFDARGLRKVYGRGDTFYKHSPLNMELWLNKSGNLLMRCWSRSKYAPKRSFIILNFDISTIPDEGKFEDFWIPEGIRTAYEDWVCDVMNW